jgi:hypothetical protein
LERRRRHWHFTHRHRQDYRRIENNIVFLNPK